MSDQTDETTMTGLEFRRGDDLNDIVAMLTKGDRILLNDRARPLEVVDTGSEKIGSNPYETLVAHLEGNGRVYRLRGECGHKVDRNHPDTTPPMLELRREDEWASTTLVTRIQFADGRQIVSDTHAEEWLAQRETDIQ